MSVRVTERLVGDVVIASGISKGPLMIAQSIDEKAKMVMTIWFSDDNKCQTGKFPGSALDRADPPAPAAKKAAGAKAPKAVPAGKGKKK